MIVKLLKAIPRAPAAFSISAIFPIKIGSISSSAFKREAAPKIRASVASGNATLMLRRIILNFKLSNSSTIKPSRYLFPIYHTILHMKRKGQNKASVLLIKI